MEIILKNTDNQIITMSISEKEVVITEMKSTENNDTEHHNYKLTSIKTNEISTIKYFKDLTVKRTGNKTVMLICLILALISLVVGFVMLKERTGIVLIICSVILFVTSYVFRYTELKEHKMYLQLENKSQQILFKKSINLSVDQVESIKSAIRNVQK